MRKGASAMPHIKHNDISLFFEDEGTGDPPLLFIHGGMNDHSYFARQVKYFQDRHRTVAVDLRGHGQSDKPRQDYTIECFADDISWLCKELRIAAPVVVGHSLGGLITLAVAARYPDLPA